MDEALVTSASTCTANRKNKRSFYWCPNWIWGYQLSKKIMEKALAIRQLVTSSTIQFLESKSSNKAFNEIMEALKDDGVNMIGVWGMAGVGKTTLFAAVVNKVKQVHLFDKVITVLVSESPDNGKIQDQIADCLDLNFEKEAPEGKAKQLRLQLKNKEKVLIVLDDMWDELDLKQIGIPFDNNRKDCKIILTTCRRSVCQKMESEVVVSLGLLDEEEAWSLFKMNATLDNASQEIIEAAKAVVKGYGGLPLAIVKSAGALRSKDDLHGPRKEDIKNALEIELEKNAYASLEKSYNQLRKTSNRCFLMCALYPNQDSIDVENLVRYAWGLGLYQNAGSIEEVRREVCEAIKELKDSCLLVEDQQKRLKMHYIVRLVAKWIASKEDNGLVAENESTKQKLEILLLDRYNHSETPYGFQMPELKVLSIEQDENFLEFDEDRFFLLTSIYLTSLRTLRLVGFKRLKGISALAKRTELEILSLHRCELEESIEKLGEFENLRVLDIRECEFLLRFPPNVISRLHKLEELRLSFGERLVDYETREKANISTAILQELNFLPRLKSLLLEVPSLSEDFVLPRVERYRIAINKCFGADPMTIPSRFLAILERFPLNVISELLWNLEFLHVSDVKENVMQCLTDTIAGNVQVEMILQNLKDVKIEDY